MIIQNFKLMVNHWAEEVEDNETDVTRVWIMIQELRNFGNMPLQRKLNPKKDR